MPRRSSVSPPPTATGVSSALQPATTLRSNTTVPSDRRVRRSFHLIDRVWRPPPSYLFLRSLCLSSLSAREIQQAIRPLIPHRKNIWELCHRYRLPRNQLAVSSLPSVLLVLRLYGPSTACLLFGVSPAFLHRYLEENAQCRRCPPPSPSLLTLVSSSPSSFPSTWSSSIPHGVRVKARKREPKLFGSARTSRRSPKETTPLPKLRGDR